MSQHVIQCLVIQQNGSEQKNLEAALRGSHFKPRYQHVNNSADLHRWLGHLPALLFCPDNMSAPQRQKLHDTLYKLAPDCIVVYYSDDRWSGLSLTSGEIVTCTLTAGRPAELRRQLDYLLAYAAMKSEFRHCKHLLSIVEHRNQWLVEYSREAVAYITRNQHLYVNAAYMHLFGFDSELGALNASVSQLVSPAHHKAFLSLSRETEHKAFLPNKFLLHMCSSHRADGFFRAEVRFIPAVFRGQRCIQLHVHPLLDTTSDRKKDKQPAAPDPWEVRAPIASKGGTKAGKATSVSRRAVAIPKPVNRNALKVDFQELLNLKGSENPALFMVRPYMKKPGTTISGKALLSKLDAGARIKVDEQCLEVAARYLYKRFDHPLKHKVWVELGDWAFTDKKGLERLLKFLNEHKAIIATFVVSVDANSCIRLRESAVKVLPLLHDTGVKIALGDIRELTPEVSALLEISGATLVRTHPDLLKQVRTSGVIPEELVQILQLENAGVVIDGVGDVNIMNLLCESNAAYLQGDVLDKFSR
ncbi:MAG: Unknown protein [uncultured Thiotrichaceae bacterium]|uniref:EAL domain-containing protein n=1 Tax=uncultured Thiotrichaceae bacterium TaxID=298394 RepID=A0A6S6SK42_9GAMM|nr:MAG: Unknown protein [uncultured Thiotrichaceae bacterium]